MLLTVLRNLPSPAALRATVILPGSPVVFLRPSLPVRPAFTDPRALHLRRILFDGSSWFHRRHFQFRAEITPIYRRLGLITDMKDAFKQRRFLIPAVAPDPVGDRQRPNDRRSPGQQISGSIKNR